MRRVVGAARGPARAPVQLLMRSHAMAVILALAATGAAPAPTPSRLAVEGTQNANVSLAADGPRVVVTWAARKQDATDVYASFSTDGGATFGAPVRVNDAPGEARASGEQAPRVAVGSSTEIAWNARIDGVSAIRAASATGRRFTPAATVHGAGLKGARGWTSLALGPDGAAHVSWLDGRVNVPPAGTPSAARHAMQQDLFHATRRPDGTRDEVLVASDVCFCCKTATAVGPDGAVYVAWRHIFPPNVRDMAVARSSDGGRTFGAPVRVSTDGWAVDGCPDDGPSIAVDARNALYVVWPTEVSAAAGRGIFYSRSTDGGRTFAARVRVDGESGAPAHPQLALAGDRGVIAWDEGGGTGPRRVRLREIGIGGEAPALGEIRTVSSGAAATYPAIAVTTDATLVAWTEETEKASDVRVLRLPR